MPKLLGVAVLAAVWITVAAVGVTSAGGTINLNRPGALEALRHSNPTHYEKIREIMEGVLHQPEVNVPGWMRTNFDARDVKYTPIVLTTHPPQKRLSFALDGTRYESVIILTNVGRELLPLK